MNVAVVFYDIAPEGGGAFTFQQSILEALAELPPGRHRFTSYSAGGAGPSERRVIGIPQTRLSRYRRRTVEVTREAQGWLGMARRGPSTWFEQSLRDHDIEFVWFASHYMTECDQPYMCTLWDLAHVEHPWFPEVGAGGEWELRERYFQRFLPRASRVLVPNAAGEETLLRAYPVTPERVVHAPFPTPSFALHPPHVDDDAVLARHGLTREGYLFYPAQFWAHKNHANALHALALRRSRGEDVPPLVLVGSDKGQLGHLRRLAATLGVEDGVRLLGFVETEELVALYRNAFALLYLSFFGPENLPPLEALALGCPVICADAPGMREQLGEAALFVAPADVEGIAAAISAVAAPALREQLRSAGVALARERTAERYVAGVLKVLDDFELIRRCWA